MWYITIVLRDKKKIKKKEGYDHEKDVCYAEGILLHLQRRPELRGKWKRRKSRITISRDCFTD